MGLYRYVRVGTGEIIGRKIIFGRPLTAKLVGHRIADDHDPIIPPTVGRVDDTRITENRTMGKQVQRGTVFQTVQTVTPPMGGRGSVAATELVEPRELPGTILGENLSVMRDAEGFLHLVFDPSARLRYSKVRDNTGKVVPGANGPNLIVGTTGSFKAVGGGLKISANIIAEPSATIV